MMSDIVTFLYSVQGINVAGWPHCWITKSNQTQLKRNMSAPSHQWYPSLKNY